MLGPRKRIETHVNRVILSLRNLREVNRGGYDLTDKELGKIEDALTHALKQTLESLSKPADEIFKLEE